MLIDIPELELVALCGGDTGTGTAYQLAPIVKEYIYGDPDKMTERRRRIGLFLVAVLENKLHIRGA